MFPSIHLEMKGLQLKNDVCRNQALLTSHTDTKLCIRNDDQKQWLCESNADD